MTEVSPPGTDAPNAHRQWSCMARRQPLLAETDLFGVLPSDVVDTLSGRIEMQRLSGFAQAIDDGGIERFRRRRGQPRRQIGDLLLEGGMIQGVS